MYLSNSERIRTAAVEHGPTPKTRASQSGWMCKNTVAQLPPAAAALEVVSD